MPPCCAWDPDAACMTPHTAFPYMADFWMRWGRRCHDWLSIAWVGRRESDSLLRCGRVSRERSARAKARKRGWAIGGEEGSKGGGGRGRKGRGGRGGRGGCWAWGGERDMRREIRLGIRLGGSLGLGARCAHLTSGIPWDPLGSTSLPCHCRRFSGDASAAVRPGATSLAKSAHVPADLTLRLQSVPLD